MRRICLQRLSDPLWVGDNGYGSTATMRAALIVILSATDYGLLVAAAGGILPSLAPAIAA